MKSPIRRSVREAVLARDGFKCQYCGKPVVTVSDCTLDHIIAISLGGDSEAGNLRTACFSCNSTKGQRSVEWLRLYWAFQRTRFANVLTMEQYHRLLGMGIALDPLHPEPFHFEHIQEPA